MKKIIPAAFVIIAAVLAVIFFSRKTISKKDADNVPSLVTADSDEKKSVLEEHNVTIVEENTPTSFLSLKRMITSLFQAAENFMFSRLNLIICLYMMIRMKL